MSIILSAVGYRYAGAAKAALRDVDLELEPGRVLGVVGANGAGKSTLCLAAVGLAPTAIGGELSGQVTIDGVPTAGTPMHDLAQRAGILLQESQTQITSGAPTVWEEIAFGPRNLSLPLDEVVQRTWRAVDSLRLGELVERDPARLSGGEAQLVALAAVLALGARYLILDEPTSQLDPLGTRLVSETLATAAKSTGAGILIVEHKTDMLASLCDEVVVLSAGTVVARGPAAEVLADPELGGWGVTPPPSVGLRRAVEAAGLEWQAKWL